MAPKNWDQRHSLQTLVMVSDDEGRFAFDGWRYLNHWFFNSEYTESKLNETRCFATTDRPVYRPGQEVKYKSWTRRVGYDRPLDEAEYARKTFRIEVYNPKNEKIHTEDIEADQFAGVDGLFALEEEATLGVYSLRVGWPRDDNRPMHTVGKISGLPW